MKWRRISIKIFITFQMHLYRSKSKIFLSYATRDVARMFKGDEFKQLKSDENFHVGNF